MNLFELIGFIKRGKNREKVFASIEKPVLPSALTRKIFGNASNSYFNVVSRSLGELKDKGLIEILNPNDKTGRIYKRTKLGDRVSRNMRGFEKK